MHFRNTLNKQADQGSVTTAPVGNLCNEKVISPAFFYPFLSFLRLNFFPCHAFPPLSPPLKCLFPSELQYWPPARKKKLIKDDTPLSLFHSFLLMDLERSRMQSEIKSAGRKKDAKWNSRCWKAAFLRRSYSSLRPEDRKEQAVHDRGEKTSGGL